MPVGVYPHINRPKHSEETKRKIGLANRGRKRETGWKHTEEAKRKMSLAQKGRIVSDEAKKKISEGHIGKKASDETKRKMSIAHGFEDNHRNWLGDEVGYSGVHRWIVKWKGKPSVCEICGTTTAKRYDWANINHTYRRVLEDYIRLCTSCHRKYDILNNNFPNNYKK